MLFWSWYAWRHDRRAGFHPRASKTFNWIFLNFVLTFQVILPALALFWHYSCILLLAMLLENMVLAHLHNITYNCLSQPFSLIASNIYWLGRKIICRYGFLLYEKVNCNGWPHVHRMSGLFFRNVCSRKLLLATACCMLKKTIHSQAVCIAIFCSCKVFNFRASLDWSGIYWTSWTILYFS